MTTDNDITTEVIEYVRDLDVLLGLDTYQGMTDAEIDKVIDYRCSVAYNEGANKAVDDARLRHMSDMKELYSETAKRSDALMRNVMSTLIPFASVTGEEVN